MSDKTKEEAIKAEVPKVVAAASAPASAPAPKVPEAPAPKVPELPVTLSERVTNLEDVLTELLDKFEEQAKAVETLKKTTVSKPKGKFGGNRTRTPIKDLKTGKLYVSKAQAGKVFASEVGMEPSNTFAWYTVEKQIRMDDNSPRFVMASPEESAKIVTEYDADQQAMVDQAIKELQAQG